MSRRAPEIVLEPPYNQALEGVLAFSDFESLERCLCTLDEIHRSYQRAGDNKGVEYCREMARLGRRRAEFISRNRRVSPAKREEKAEMAFWFRIWLETPEIFPDWLAMRKATEEFRALRERWRSAPKTPKMRKSPRGGETVKTTTETQRSQRRK